MDIQKEVSITIKDDDGKTLNCGDVIIFNVAGVDCIGNYLGIAGGKVVIGNITNDDTRKYLPKSIKSVIKKDI